MTTARKNPDTTGAKVPVPINVRPIGYVESDYARPADVAHTHSGWTADTSRIRFSRYAGGLRGLAGYSHIIVLYWVHRAREWKMPKHHHKPPEVKVFATRMPVRPNPIGLSVVELLDFSPETGEVSVRGLDAVDGTPVLDIKPYISNFDSYPGAEVPEWVARHLAGRLHRAREHSHDAVGERGPSGPQRQGEVSDESRSHRPDESDRK